MSDPLHCGRATLLRLVKSCAYRFVEMAIFEMSLRTEEGQDGGTAAHQDIE